MIEITCTSCKRVLNVDDAFAGGVCRCQYCGTIQTVAAKGSAQKAAAGAGKGSKTLFENKARSAGVGSGSGLEDLADVVQSSGLSDSGLRNSPSTAPAAQRQNFAPVLGLAAAVIVVLLAVVLVLVFRNPATPTPISTGPNPPAIIPPPAPSPDKPAAAPNFCGIAIDQPVVVYVIDNGASSADVFDAVKSVLFKSIESLGPDRQFQVLFWNPDSDTFPADHTTFAVKENIDVARKKLQNVTAAGATDPLAILKTAFADNPGQVILVTAKAGDLDDSLVDQVIQLRGNSKARIDCVAINGVPADKVLARIAAQTGGKFLPLPEAQLKAFSF
ncbi:MAG: hypothetical protein ABSH08_03440 [Tepidisphaeraceae bacterium]|jgi:hypothetical protein